MQSFLLGLMASTVIGLASAAEQLQPCGNAFYVPSQVRSSPKYSARFYIPNSAEPIVYVLQRQQALPRLERSGNAALRGGLLLGEHVLV